MASGVTTVDCHKQVRSWKILRSLIQLLIPTCNSSTTILEDQHTIITSKKNILRNSSLITTTSTITGTIFQYRRGRISFCIQSNAKSRTPILLLELVVPTNILAREMRRGTLRIALESSNENGRSCSVWTMYCNGKKVGYAVKRKPSNIDFEVLSLMRSVVVGTGVMKCNGEGYYYDEFMYLRGSFERVGGSNSQCQSFHLIDPEGGIDQELSIFFFSSTSQCSSNSPFIFQSTSFY
ncbi:protein MIZU-KUSSEI 1-like [Cicer arietinum]|uniref:Protein MIZU-KUSSEI 1-like n=1 Tax=Cicer arietinum TaxID=3827 RepID=A0A1S2YGE2_CICAR|nr:protein MIZU-KUSSEI 1-like [Cicer arietinum]